jgi:hypothetical protein
MFADTACSIMGKKSEIILRMLVFSSSRIRALLLCPPCCVPCCAALFEQCLGYFNFSEMVEELVDSVSITPGVTCIFEENGSNSTTARHCTPHSNLDRVKLNSMAAW